MRLEAIVCQTQSSHRVPKKEGKERKRGGREEVRWREREREEEEEEERSRGLRKFGEEAFLFQADHGFTENLVNILS